MSKDVIAALWSKFLGYACYHRDATRARAGAIARSAGGAAFAAAVLDKCKPVGCRRGLVPTENLIQTVNGLPVG